MQRALFLDRDGVINVDHGYVHRPEDIEFIDGIFDLVRYANEYGYRVCVITNQAGIARGYYGEAEFERLTGWLIERFLSQDAALDAVYYCPDHPEHGLGDYKRATPMRKPGPGMLLQARADFGLEMARSLLVGDRASDIEAGLTAGVGCNLLLDPDGSVPLAAGAHRIGALSSVAAWLQLGPRDGATPSRRAVVRRCR